MHGSVSVFALQRKEAEKSAYGKMHHPAFKSTEIYFREQLLCNILVKNGITDLLGLILENAQFRQNIPGVTRRSLMQREFHIRN